MNDPGRPSIPGWGGGALNQRGGAIGRSYRRPYRSDRKRPASFSKGSETSERSAENCTACGRQASCLFRRLPPEVLPLFETIKHTVTYPRGAILFTEGEPPLGVFVLCSGRVKLSISSSTGKALIPNIAQPGEVLGLSGVIVGQPYSMTAETIDGCRVNFVRKGDFLGFMREHTEFCFCAAEELSEKYDRACRFRGDLSLPRTVEEKLAKLLLGLGATEGSPEAGGTEPQAGLTHEQIAGMIGTRRETVTRLLSKLKKSEIVHPEGTAFVIRNEPALRRMACCGRRD